MKLEIKQRIEQIKAGQVPDGYKSTGGVEYLQAQRCT